MDNQVLFGEGKQLRINVNIDSLLVYGKGKSYGAEFFVRKIWANLQDGFLTRTRKQLNNSMISIMEKNFLLNMTEGMYYQ